MDSYIEKLTNFIEKIDPGSTITFRVSSPRISLKDLEWETVEMAYQLMSDLPASLAQFIARKFVSKNFEHISKEFILIKDLSDGLISLTVTEEENFDHVTSVSPPECPPPPSSNPRKLYYDSMKISEFINVELKTFILNAFVKSEECMDQFLEIENSCKYEFCVSAMKNGRRKMEDRHVTVKDLRLLFPEREDLKGLSFYAVFDGHLGVDCANYAAVHLLPYLVQNELFPLDIEASFKSAFESVDLELNWKYEHESMRSGCTAVCCILTNDKVHLAWVGDSLAGTVLMDTVSQLTAPHNPDNEEEYKRVEKSGGVVVSIQGELRVNGCLNVSRSLGDVICKPAISGVPDLFTFDLSPAEFALVLGCDGVWDSLLPHQMHEKIKKFTKENKVETRCKLSSALCNAAKENGSTDNVTAIVVFLQKPEKVWQFLKL